MKTIISKMLKATVICAACAALCLAGALGLAGCDDLGAGSIHKGTSTEGDVAATVGDNNIYEADVTYQVEAIRAQYGYTDDTMWAWMLALSGYTPETFREYIIDSMSYEYVVPVAAAQKGVTVPAEDVDAAVAGMKETYGLTDEQWATALANSGYTEESYRETVELSLMEEALYEAVTEGAEMTDELFEEYGMPYVEAYYANIKRSSHILFAVEDQETAERVLAELQEGTLTFDDAVAQYSIDTGSAVAGGDVGWSGIHTFVDEYQGALDELEPGQMSGLVLSQFGYHIILCTDAFVYTDETTVADLPEDLYEHVSTNYLGSSLASITYNEYIESVREDMGYVINPMPEGLSYDVDIEAALASLYGDTEVEGAGDGTGDGAGDDEAGADVAGEGEGTTEGTTEGAGE